MSLATRCTACGTVFRVVQDQLRMSSGWVRCGRCSEVFNALESLVDLGAPEPGPPSAHASRIMDTLAQVSAAAEEDRLPATGGEGADGQPALAERAAAPVMPVTPGVGAALAPAAALPPAPAADTPPPVDAAAAGDDPPPARLPAPAGAQAPPGFVRQVDRAARWRHPLVRAALASACVGAALLLAVQIHQTHHDWLAARWPALRAASQWLCAWRGCEIEPPRQLDALVVDSSALVRAGAPGTYQLSLSLRNRSPVAARVPALDLVLSDAGGQTTTRRVLSLAELGVRGQAIAGGGELNAAARLRVDGPPVVGYTIEIFYP